MKNLSTPALSCLLAPRPLRGLLPRLLVVRPLRGLLLRLRLCVVDGYLAFWPCGHFAVCYLASSLCCHHAAFLLWGRGAFVAFCFVAASASSAGGAAPSSSPPSTPPSLGRGRASVTAYDAAFLVGWGSGPSSLLSFVSYEAAPLFFRLPARRHCWPSTPYDTAFLSFALPIDHRRLSTSSTPSLSCSGSDICVIIGLFSSPHSAGGVESRLPPPLSVCKFTGDMFGNGRLLTNPPSFDCFADPRLRRAGLDSGEFACLDCLPVCVGGECWI